MGAAFTLSLVSTLHREVALYPRTREAFHSRTRSEALSEWRITLAIQREGLSETALNDIVRALRTLTGDDKLTLEAVESGSVILRLKGSVDGYRVLEHLFQNGNLASVLGLPVEAIAFTETNSIEPSQIPNTSATSDQHRPCYVFCSYSHRDAAFRERLERHLRVLERGGLIQTWHDRKLAGGDDWKGQIDANLDRAQLILVLVSADFLASDYCYDVEMKRALERHNLKEARVVPIILRPASWRHTPLADLQVLPTGAKPISQWSDRDGAFNSIAEDLRSIVLQMRTS